MQRLSPDNFGSSENPHQTFPGHVMNFGPHIDPPEVRRTLWSYTSPYATCFFSESFEPRRGIPVCCHASC